MVVATGNRCSYNLFLMVVWWLKSPVNCLKHVFVAPLPTSTKVCPLTAESGLQGVPLPTSPLVRRATRVRRTESWGESAVLCAGFFWRLGTSF